MRRIISPILFLTALCIPTGTVLSAASAPNAAEKTIKAYWYNVPADSVSFTLIKQTARFRSTLQIFGPIPGATFTVRATAYNDGNRRVFDRTFAIREGKPDSTFSLTANGDSFLLVCPVEQLPRNPEQLEVVISSPEKQYSRQVRCRYHRLFGKITDFEGRPFRAFVSIRPDAFDFDTTIWSDAGGNYSIELPERTYSNIAVVDEYYFLKVAVSWAWLVFLDSDQQIDFKVGTGEVYNLKVWPNNGGYKTFLVSFRPMDITGMKTGSVSLGGETYKLTEFAPELRPEDMTVRVNGQPAKIISLQHYYETGPGNAMRACLLQVERTSAIRPGKQTVAVEFSKETEIGGKQVRCTSLGQCQFTLNYYGLSEE
jgi:hypothetical protein